MAQNEGECPHNDGFSCTRFTRNDRQPFVETNLQRGDQRIIPDVQRVQHKLVTVG